jgi:itaconyl-CoA hydratase
MIDRRVSVLTGTDNFFEDFTVGRRFRHARGATVGDVENNLVTKQVMNTAQGHWNEHAMAGSAMGDGRLVFGLVTGTLVFGLASQDTAENALAELGCTGLRFKAPVHLGDTIYAYTEVLAVGPSPEHPDAGVVRFKHWGVTHDDRLVFEGERIVLVKRRSHWGLEGS